LLLSRDRVWIWAGFAGRGRGACDWSSRDAAGVVSRALARPAAG
jgi:hypothetical protein